MNVSHNKRYQNTDKIIQESFLELLEDDNPERISITEICEKAKINRSTFYTHFFDIDDLLHNTEKRIHCNLMKQYKNTESKIHNFINREYFITFLKFVYQHKNFYKYFVNNCNDFPIHLGFKELFGNIMKPYYKTLGIHSEDEMVVYFIYFQAGFTMVLKHWLNHKCIMPVGEIADILVNCIPIQVSG